MNLILIPARGGSKGIPGKNIRLLCGKPLIWYSIENAKGFDGENEICVSTDDRQIAETAARYGITVPFLRPSQLATDTAGTREVILHALQFYEGKGASFETVILLQPTSPLRKSHHITEALSLYSPGVDMVVSVTLSGLNPWYNLYRENHEGYLERTISSDFRRRQDCPPVYEVNGAVYIINPQSIKEKEFHDFNRIVKYEMGKEYSVDIDDELDWKMAELLMEKE